MTYDSYYTRTGENAFTTTDAVRGAWNVNEQHIAPSIGLLTHVLECDHAARHPEPLTLARLSVDILGVLPMGEVETASSVVRPGRTIELAEATLSHAGRVAAIGRAWFLQPSETTEAVGSEFAPMPPRESMTEVSAGGIWPGDFVRTVQVFRAENPPGRGQLWMRPQPALIAGEEVSPTARLLGMVDIANGVATRVAPGTMYFPNIDLSAQLFRAPETEWLGFDITVSFGPNGVGLTHSVLHDERGPIGALQQTLTLRPALG